MIRSNSESQIQREIRLALGAIPECDFQRLSQVVAEQDGRTVRGGLCPGAADLIGCVLGRFVALEVKTATGRLSPEQEQWHRRMRRVGAVVEVVRSKEEAVAVVRRVIAEEQGR
jgi:hypothetical protein